MQFAAANSSWVGSSQKEDLREGRPNEIVGRPEL